MKSKNKQGLKIKRHFEYVFEYVLILKITYLKFIQMEVKI